MQSVTSNDGTRIAYETHGEGQPLVLLHGDSTSDYWDPVVPRFADDYAVVVPDRRGRGESGDGDEYDLGREVADALAVVEAVVEQAGDGDSTGDSTDDEAADEEHVEDEGGHADPVLFGHSFGGLQAIEAARDASVEAVIAYEPAVLVGEYRERADLADRMEARIAAGERRAAMKLHVNEVIHGGDLDDAALDRWLDAWPPWPEYVRFAENTLRMNRAIERYRLPETLDVDAPALLLTGSEGPSHLRDSVRAVHDALPDSELVEFDGVGHSGPTEATDRVVDEVRAFLE